MSPFRQIGNIPFDTGVAHSLFPNHSHINEKLASLEKAGHVIRLKRGLYVAAKDESGVAVSRELIANHLYGPSYVGCEYALRYYGLIPERVYRLTSVTTKKSRNFENATGHYSYQQCTPEYFAVGVRMTDGDGVRFLLASPEKALCDVINFSDNVTLRYMTDVVRYLEEDIRFDTDELSSLDLHVLEVCASVSRRESSIRTLIKYIRYVRHL